MSAADGGEREGADAGEKEEQTFGSLSDKFKHTVKKFSLFVSIQ